MWEAEISNSKTSNVVDPIGSLANWYNKANAFWNVSPLLSRKQIQLIME